MDQAIGRSRELFESGYYCAESVLLAISEAKGIKTEIIPKIATGFCSGMARTSRQCGALSGGIMSLGLFSGRSEPGDDVDEIYDLVSRLIHSFEDKFGSTTCSGLLGCDLGTEEGQMTFMEQDLLEHCCQFTEAATRLTIDLLESHP
jgi:C_GCAxxG_C_C family probable redox protein